VDERKGVNMEHADCLRKLASETSYTERELRQLFQHWARIVREALYSGQDVNINGIGKLINRLGKARMGRDPRTLEPLYIPARRRILFRKCVDLAKSLRLLGDNPLAEEPSRFFGKESDSGKVRSRSRSRQGKDSR
jgi:nucleoid DNA-binding protein